MSNKMKNFLNRPIVIKKIINENKSVLNLICETVNIDKNDKEMLYHFISTPGNRTYTLKTYSDTFSDVDRTIVISRKSGNMVFVSMYSGLEEISDFIIELCDQMGWKFNSNIQADTERIIFTIFMENGL